MNHCHFRTLDTKRKPDNTVCYSSLTEEVSYPKESGTTGEPDRRTDAVADSLAASMGEYGKKNVNDG